MTKKKPLKIYETLYSVLEVDGWQRIRVHAKDEEEAIKLFEKGKGEVIDTDIEVTYGTFYFDDIYCGGLVDD